MTKAEMAKEIGRLEGELSASENARRDIESKLSGAKRTRTAGAAAVLIGILGVLFLNGLWVLWIFLIIIGALTLVTAIVKQSGTSQDVATLDQQITSARAKLAELRALITA